jgi:hypothetical protein
MTSFQNTCCSGCYPIFQPNQQAHQDFGGCMEIKYDFEEDEPHPHPYFQNDAFITRFKKVSSYKQKEVLEVMTDLLKEQTDITLPCLLGIIDKLIDPTRSYSDIGAGIYIWSVEVWNCFIMNAYIEWQKSGQYKSKKMYSFELLISHTHLVY